MTQPTAEEKSLVRHLTAADYTATPWRNGGGTTTEIAISPSGASLGGGFDWRLSIAEVAQDGPFSSFPGYQRSLSVISGGGILLDAGEEGDIELRTPFKPVSFPGEWEIHGRLLGAALRDLNLIYKRATTAGRVGFLRIADTPLNAESDAQTLLILPLAGGPLTASWDKRAAEAQLEEGETLILERRGGGHAVRLTAASGEIQAAFVEISKTG
ncbi:MAG: HutD family protein [Rhodovibrionaceae bacterium]